MNNDNEPNNIQSSTLWILAEEYSVRENETPKQKWMRENNISVIEGGKDE